MRVPGQINSLRGIMILPGDKSIAHRSLIHAAISNGDCVLTNIPSSSDVNATINVLKQLKVPVNKSKSGEMIVMGGGGSLSPSDEPLNCVNSGTTMRLIMGILAACPFESILVGDESLSRRPMERVAEPLRLMGASINTTEGHSPVRIKGKSSLNPLTYRLPVASAQVKSALLYAALYADGESVITEPALSRDHTEIALEKICPGGYSRTASEEGCTHYVMGPSNLHAFDNYIPGDPSSAAYLIAIALLKPDSRITFHNMLLNPKRIKYLDILQKMGARILVSETSMEFGEQIGEISVTATKLENVSINAKDIPFIIDEIPILAMIASASHGRFEIRGASELRVKESDRLKAIIKNLRSLNASIDEYPDGFSFKGPLKLTKASIDTFNDHRILMSLISLSIIHDLDLEFDDLSPLKISFPEFLDYLNLLSC